MNFSSLGTPGNSDLFVTFGENGHPGQFTIGENLIIHEWLRHGAVAGLTPTESLEEYQQLQRFKTLTSLHDPIEVISIGVDVTYTWDSDIEEIFANDYKD